MKVLSEKTRKLISDKRKLQVPPMLGRKHSPETIEKMRNTAKGRIIPRYVLEESAKARRGKPAWNRGLPATWATGEKSHFWKGGVTDAHQKFIGSGEWRRIRIEIYKRDNWLCQECGKHCHDDIQCHHIIPYRVSKDNSPENLITLCVRCHAKVENQYRVKNEGGKYGH